MPPRRLTTLILLPLLLVACAEFTAEPTKPATRSVRGPESVASPGHEYDNSTTSGMPLFEADFPKNKDDTFHIKTPMDTARATTQAATPSTRPGETPIEPPSFTPSHSSIDLTPTGTRPADH